MPFHLIRCAEMCNDFGRSFQHDTKTRNDKRYPTGVGLPAFLSNNMVIIFQPTLFAFFLACLHTDHIYTLFYETAFLLQLYHNDTVLLISLQDLDDLSETDGSSEDQHHNIKPELMEEELKSRLFQLAAKMSDKETSSGEEQESEPRTDPENQKESLSSEENGKSIQEELKKVSAYQKEVGPVL